MASRSLASRASEAAVLLPKAVPQVVLWLRCFAVHEPMSLLDPLEFARDDGDELPQLTLIPPPLLAMFGLATIPAISHWQKR